MKNSLQFAAVTVLLVASVAVVVHVQGSGSYSGAGGGASRVASPSVVYSLWSHDDEDHVPVLEFLVLFRGRPGWFLADGPGTNGYSFGGGSGRTTSHTFAATGGVTVSIDSDSSVPTKKLTVVANLATILDRQIGPDEVNVVLVDGVDAPGGQPSIETRVVGPRLVGDGDALTRVLTGFPELMDFLRCDAAFPPALPGAPDVRRRLFGSAPNACSPMRSR